MFAPFTVDDTTAVWTPPAIISSYNQSETSFDAEPTSVETWRYNVKEATDVERTGFASIEKVTLVSREFQQRTSEIAQLLEEHFEKQKISNGIIQHIKLRVEKLKSEARLENDLFNDDSARDLIQFIKNHPYSRKPSVFLVDNGNLRAVWKDESGNHFGMQFLGKSNAQYVIFSKRDNAENVSRVAGRDNLQGVALQVNALEINDLIYA